MRITADHFGTTSVLSSGILIDAFVVSRSLKSNMADLLGDDSQYSEETPEDPAAEFLAREQDDLAELGEDLDGAANADEVKKVEKSPVNEVEL